MKRNFLLLFATLILSFALTSVFDYESTQAGSPLTSELLSDHTLTSASATFPYIGFGIETSDDVAHVYWQENGDGAEGSDLFYRQIPGGSTIRLSDLSQTEGDVYTFTEDSRGSAIAPDGTVHIIWLEETNTSEKDDLFYWSAATGTLLLSDRTETEGFVYIPNVLLELDKDGNPHVLWYEETATGEGRDIFYWNRTTGTHLLTDRNQTEGGFVNFSYVKILLSDNGTPHISWSEFGNDGTTPLYFYWNPSFTTPAIFPDLRSFATITVVEDTAHTAWQSGFLDGPIVYWNSSTKTEQIIPSSDDNPTGLALEVDSANNIHILWSEAQTNNCLSHWDSVSQLTEVIVTGENCRSSYGTYIDDSDVIHTIYTDDPTGNDDYYLHYWNSTLANPNLLKANTYYTSVDNLLGTGNGVVHVTWRELPNSSDDNLYHWDNVSQTVTNLSQLAGSNSRLGPRATPALNNAEELHLLWPEQVNGSSDYEYFYWNSEDKTIQNLFTKFGISSLPSSSLDELTMAYTENGAPYLIWYGLPDNGPEGFYFWNSAKDEIHLLGESLPCNGGSYSFSNDSNLLGNIYFAWLDGSTFTNYFWSETSGQVDISSTVVSEIYCDPPFVKVSDNGRIFVVWIEESDTAGEGLDLFAGWIETSISQVFLPIATK